MKTPYSYNVLKVKGLDSVCSVKDCYLGILKMLYDEFTRGYVEPNVMLFHLYGSHFESSQLLFKRRLPPDALCFFTIPWDAPHCYTQLRTLFSLLHICFASYPDFFIDEEAFHAACSEFEVQKNAPHHLHR